MNLTSYTLIQIDTLCCRSAPALARLGQFQRDTRILSSVLSNYYPSAFNTPTLTSEYDSLWLLPASAIHFAAFYQRHRRVK